MKGFWSVPKRGAEVGGVLFGRVVADEGETVVQVEDYEPVECEYRRGPSFVLSENDRRRLERTLRKGTAERQVVGWYRSHTRLGLYLDQDDSSLIQSYFPGPSQVFLLVRPHASKTSVGGFFFWEEGTIHRQSAYLEFPFSRAEILKRNEGVKRREGADVEAAVSRPAAPPVPAAAVADAEPQPERPVRPALPDIRERIERGIAMLRASPMVAQLRKARWRPAAIAALVLLCLGAAEYQFMKFLARRAPAAAAEADYAPALRIERNGSYLQVNWNRNAPSIVHAERAVLQITDGDYSKELQLDPRQLRTGSVAYSPASGDVNFRLELVGGKTTVSESLRVVEGVSRPAAQARGSRTRPSPTAKHSAPAGTVTFQAEKAQAGQQPAKRASRVQRRAWYDDGL
jgi:hypothetical protein